MESWAPVPTLALLLPRLSGLVWPAPPPFPASSILPQASDHNHRECLSSFLLKPTHCLPSALYLYQHELFCLWGGAYMLLRENHFYDAESSSGSITQWSWLVVLNTPTGMPGLWGTKTTGQTVGQNSIYKTSFQNLKSTHANILQ